jgi:hypothetical protein
MRRLSKSLCINGLRSKTIHFTRLEFMALLKGGSNLWKRTEIILKSDKLIIKIIAFTLFKLQLIILAIKKGKKNRHCSFLNNRYNKATIRVYF